MRRRSAFPVEQNYPDAIAGKPMKTYIDWIAPTFVLSLTGLPVACVPAGLDSDGMPVGFRLPGGSWAKKPCWRWLHRCKTLRPVSAPRTACVRA